MATNGNGPEQAYAPVLTAMSTMRDGMREQKQAAHAYLESFQKSVGSCFDDFAPFPRRNQEAHRFCRQKPGRLLLGFCNPKLNQRLNYLLLQR